MRWLALLVLLAAPGRAQSVYAVDLPADLTVSAVSAAGIAVPYALSDQLITPRCPCSASEVPSFDRGAIGNHNHALDVASDLEVGALFVAPVLADAAAVGFRPELAEDTVVFAETLLVNGALVTAAKYIVQRPLPRTYAGDPSLLNSPGGYRSFYSGHTSTTAAALGVTAMTLRYRYGQMVWPWIVDGVITGLVATQRVLAGRHFPSDVAIGAVMGTAVGIAVPALHHRAAAVHLAVAPVEGGAALSLSAHW
jgi:membrane-associated phospholipid phosphatase